MGLFGFRKKDNVLDLSEKYRKQKQKERDMVSDSTGSSDSSQKSGSATPFSFFDSGSHGSESSSSSGLGSSQENSDVLDLSGGNYSEDNEKKKRLAKRILDMTTKIEDISNQIYHLQQRIEVLERKSGSDY